MLPENKYAQYGIERLNGLNDIKCIIIHNTNNYYMSARDIFDYLNNDCKESTGCNYVLDHNEVIQVMPDEWGTYNTGKGEDYACKYGLAIEICSNLNDEEYMLGQDRGVALIKELMTKYNIPIEEVYFHIDFNSQYYCPATILDKYKTKANFIKEEF